MLGLDVDKCPREDTRKSQSLVHQNGVLGVLGKIREKPHVSLNPLGRRARDARKAACKDSEWAYYYALEVDKCPREDTRKIACEDPGWAYYYARDVDKCPHEDTWAAVRNTEWEEKYQAFINSLMKEKII